MNKIHFARLDTLSITPIGPLLAAFLPAESPSCLALRGLWFVGHPAIPREVHPDWPTLPTTLSATLSTTLSATHHSADSATSPHPGIPDALRALDSLFTSYLADAGSLSSALPELTSHYPLRPGGSDFDTAVWSLLQDIPAGETATYGDLARRYGRLRHAASDAAAESATATASAAASGRLYARAVGGALGRNPLSILVPCHRVIARDGSLGGYAGGPQRKAFLLEHEAAPILWD